MLFIVIASPGNIGTKQSLSLVIASLRSQRHFVCVCC